MGHMLHSRRLRKSSCILPLFCYIGDIVQTECLQETHFKDSGRVTLLSEDANQWMKTSIPRYLQTEPNLPRFK